MIILGACLAGGQRSASLKKGFLWPDRYIPIGTHGPYGFLMWMQSRCMKSFAFVLRTTEHIFTLGRATWHINGRHFLAWVSDTAWPVVCDCVKSGGLLGTYFLVQRADTRNAL
jgi:hypothetical protein